MPFGAQNGLKMGEELGVNPYKFGTVSGTDAHTALVTPSRKTISSASIPGPSQVLPGPRIPLCQVA